MSLMSSLFLLVAVFFTAMLSGMFGMAGGFILMGVLVMLLSVPQAMVAHGMLQLVANFSRVWIWRAHINWRTLMFYFLGLGLAFAALMLIAWRPERHAVLLLLGMVPLVVWVPKDFFHIDATQPLHAFIAGVTVTALTTFAGVAGPVMNVFFVHARMTRHEIVATMSLAQSTSHMVKIAFWAVAAYHASQGQLHGLILLYLLAVPLSIAGSKLGSNILHRMSHETFVGGMKWLVSALGVIYLVKAFNLWPGLGG